MPDLQSAVEDWLAAMPEPEFRALVWRTRGPDESMPASSLVGFPRAGEQQ